MFIEFDDSLLTGNKVIDEQHKEWIERINKLTNACEKGTGKLEAIKMLDYMADYAEVHFAAEEALQEKTEYPGTEEHKKKHAEFKQAVKELHEMLEEEEGPSEAFVKVVNKNVVDWVYNHIKAFDCSVATYVNMKLNPDLV